MGSEPRILPLSTIGYVSRAPQLHTSASARLATMWADSWVGRVAIKQVCVQYLISWILTVLAPLGKPRMAARHASVCYCLGIMREEELSRLYVFCGVRFNRKQLHPSVPLFLTKKSNDTWPVIDFPEYVFKLCEKLTCADLQATKSSYNYLSIDDNAMGRHTYISIPWMNSCKTKKGKKIPTSFDGQQ